MVGGLKTVSAVCSWIASSGSACFSLPFLCVSVVPWKCPSTFPRIETSGPFVRARVRTSFVLPVYASLYGRVLIGGKVPTVRSVVHRKLYITWHSLKTDHPIFISPIFAKLVVWKLVIYVIWPITPIIITEAFTRPSLTRSLVISSIGTVQS